MTDTAALVKTLVSLLVIVNPLGAVPVFLSLTHDITPAARNQVARTSAIAVIVVLMVSALIGKHLLDLFGISLPSFRVAGGVLFFLMALDMLNARPSRSRETPEENLEAERRQDVAIVPIAIPQLAGPGAIGTVILFADEASLWPHMLVVTGVILLTGIASYISLRLAAPIGSALGQTGINILTRVMGLLLVAFGVETIVGGLHVLWFALGSK